MRVLIIDDEKNILFSLKGILEDENYICKTINDGTKAIDNLNSFNPDIVLLDVKLSDCSGLDILKKIKKIDQYIEVIMISGHSGISEAVEAMKLGAYDFLEKPLSLPLVKVTVQKALKYRNINIDYKRLKASNDEKYQIIGDSDKIRSLKEMISKVAKTNAKILISGESGTGKELIAYAIHNQSDRSDKPFIKFNSAAIPKDLVESELFGFEKGAFTGAHKTKKGKLEEADGGTLFLDEIGDMDLSAQAKILRVIQEGEFERVGSNKTKKIDTRIIAATHKDLKKMVQHGSFREDLFYRLNVVPLKSAPLRKHPSDIPQLIDYYGKMFSKELNVREKKFSQKAIDEIMHWQFPGNVRELKNLVERLFILVDGDVIEPDDLDMFKPNRDYSEESFWYKTDIFNKKKKEFERKYLKYQLKKHNNNVTKTAKALKMHQSNLSRKLKDLEINY